MLKEDRCIYLSMSHHHTYYVTSSYMLKEDRFPLVR